MGKKPTLKKYTIREVFYHLYTVTAKSRTLALKSMRGHKLQPCKIELYGRCVVKIEPIEQKRKEL